NDHDLYIDDGYHIICQEPKERTHESKPGAGGGKSRAGRRGSWPAVPREGIRGIAVAEIMKGAGLTHGGFYHQFGSKDELAAEACGQVLSEQAAGWRKLAAGDDPLGTLVNSYLSARHRDGAGRGCAIACLAAEAVRQPAPVRATFTKGLRDFIEVLTTFVTGR